MVIKSYDTIYIQLDRRKHFIKYGYILFLEHYLVLERMIVLLQIWVYIIKLYSKREIRSYFIKMEVYHFVLTEKNKLYLNNSEKHNEVYILNESKIRYDTDDGKEHHVTKNIN